MNNKKINTILKRVSVLVYLLGVILVGFGIRRLFNESYSLPDNWYTSYTYTKNDTSH